MIRFFLRLIYRGQAEGADPKIQSFCMNYGGYPPPGQWPPFY